jgi:hypothetical protein
VFATIFNAGAVALDQCQIQLPTSAPAGMSMIYETTNPATNQVTSGQDPMVSIGAGASQSFVLAFQDTSASLDPSQPLLFVCASTNYAPIMLGVNTIDLQFSSTPVPDLIALAATISNNGIVEVPVHGAGAFAIATDNIGVDATITVTADTGPAKLPLTMTLCQTTADAQCLAAPAPSVTLDLAANATPTFSIFVIAEGSVAFAPGSSRVFVRFLDGAGVSHGSTSVAVETN